MRSKNWIKALFLVVLVSFLQSGALYCAPQVTYNDAGEMDFYSVLNILLHRFTEDLKGIDQRKLSKISPYKVSLSGDVPRSFAPKLKDLIEERVTRDSQVKMVKCVPCFKTLVTTEEDNLVIRQGVQKIEELQKIAKELGVRVFLESGLSFHPDEMVLTVSLFDAYRGDVIWSRSYSSKDPAFGDRDPSLKAKVNEEEVKRSFYKINVSPGVYYFQGEDGSLIQYPGASVSLLEFMDGFLSHFGVTFAGFTPPLFNTDEQSKNVLFDGGGLLEVRLYGDFGGDKIHKSGFIGGGPLFTSNVQSFLADIGGQLDIGKKFGLVGSLFYVMPSTAVEDDDVIKNSGSGWQLSSQKKERTVQSVGINLAFNIRW